MILINRVPFESICFPDGTSLLRISKEVFLPNDTVNITWNYDDDAELFKLICITRHLKALGYHKLTLTMPYIPNARMDRVKSEDEVFTLKWFAGLINDLDFQKIYVLDAHSNVSLALLHNVTDRSPAPYVEKVLNQLPDRASTIFFFPDEGAMKRYSTLSALFDLPYTFAMKKRDWRSGKIRELQVIADDSLSLKGKDILIVDDICSKGGTFFHSAKALKELGVRNIFLYISHCENTIQKGDLLSGELISRIYTTDSIYRMQHPMIEVISSE